MTALKSASPLYERVNNAHHGFMKAFKIVHLFFMSLAKNRMVVYEDHKNASPFYECFNNVQHGFMKALKNVHLPSMSLSKICITIYEGHKKTHLLCTGASARCITVLRRR